MLGIGNFANKLRKLRILRDQKAEESADANRHHRGVTLTTTSVLEMMQRRRKVPSRSDLQTSFEGDLSDKLSSTAHESSVSKLSKRVTKKLLLALPHIGLLCFMCSYTVIGAAIFSSVEFPNELAHKTEQINKLKILQQSLIDKVAMVRENSSISRVDLDDLVNSWLDQMTSAVYEAKKTSQVSAAQVYDNTTEPKYQWSFSSAVMFATTVVTTIGYGNIVPATGRGQGICLFYAALGVPLTLITIADLGKFVSAFILWLYRCCGRVKVKLTQLWQIRKSAGRGHNRQRRTYIEPNALDSAKLTKDPNEDEDDDDDDDEDTVPPLFVMMVLLGYMAVGAAMFTHWEEWSFGDAMYYCFVTVTTVGFGDLVPSDNSHFMLTLLYVFCGLVVTTMCIDLVGTHYIHKIHYVGRRMAAARELALLGGFRNIAALKRRYNLTDAEIQKLLGIKVKTTVMRPYIPANIRRLLYIDYDRYDDTTLASGFTTAPLDGDTESLCDFCTFCPDEFAVVQPARVNRSISEHGELGNWGLNDCDSHKSFINKTED